MAACNQLIHKKDDFLPGMKLAVERALGKDNSHRIEEIEEQLEALQKKLFDKADAKKGFETLAEEIDALREEKQMLLLEDANNAGTKKRLEELEAFIDMQDTNITEKEEKMVRQLIEKITVYDDHLVFVFKSGIETIVQM